MLGSFTRMRLQAFDAHTLSVGKPGQDGLDARDSQFGGFLDDEICSGLLDRGEHKPQIGRILLWFSLRQYPSQNLAAARLQDLGPPCAVDPVKHSEHCSGPAPHDVGQVVRLGSEAQFGARDQRCVDKEPDFWRVLCHTSPMSTPDHIPETLPDGRVADAPPLNWVDRYAPERAKPYLRLSRADRPIGTWLLLLPCWWGLALAIAAAPQSAGWSDLWIAVGCGLGAFLMRGAGCTWNDLADQKIDASVARTASRPLPAGQVSRRGAVIWMCVQAGLAFGILLTFNTYTILLACSSLVFVAIYPFAKRFTWWPQLFLGLAFNWGALVGWAAHTGGLTAPPFALYAAGILWTLFYDTIYAHQDKEDDALIGVKSTARLFGAQTGRWLLAFLIGCVLLMAIAVIDALAGVSPLAMVVALAAVWAFGWHLTWQMKRLKIDEPEVCLAVFHGNRDAGMIPAAGFLAAALAATVA